MRKISCFLLASTLTAFIVVALGGDLSPTSAEISPENYQNFFQISNQQLETEIQALESEEEGEEPQTLEDEPEEEQNLERKDEQLDQEMQMEEKNSGEELGVDALDDILPSQPPDEEVEMRF